MLLRIVLFFVMTVGLAGFAAVAWISTRPPPPSIMDTVATAAPATETVLTAVHTMRPGILLKPEDVTGTTFVKSAVPQGAQLDTAANRAELLGAMLRRTVLAGEVLLPAHVMRAGDRGFLAAVLGPGMRATTVGVDAVTGTAGLIWPGDHVDLILTETIDDPGAPLGRRIAGETVLHNVRVIAIDQELMQGANAANAANPNAAAQSRTVTLEVTPTNAERIAVATRLGHLSLSVISADTADVPTTSTAMTDPIIPAALTIPAASGAPLAVTVGRAPITWGSDVSSALQSGRKGDPATGMLRVFDGSNEGKEYHFQ